MRQVSLTSKCIFLDLDGTLVDSTEAYFEAARASFKAIGQAPPTNETALEIPRRLEQGYSINDITNGETKKFLKTYMKTYYLVTPQKTRLIPNVSATLEALSSKNTLALVTMRHVPRLTIVRELDYFGISRFFTRIVTAMDSCKPKPSPEALLNSAEALDVKISDCLIVGDSVNDVRAGRAAGAQTVAVLSGLFACEELAREKPDLILEDITALPDFIA